jgi:hypothetical protein
VGNPHAGFDEAGAGNVTMGAGLRPRTKVLDEPPDPKVRAPVLDPTCEGSSQEPSLAWCAVTITAKRRQGGDRPEPRGEEDN